MLLPTVKQEYDQVEHCKSCLLRYHHCCRDDIHSTHVRLLSIALERHRSHHYCCGGIEAAARRSTAPVWIQLHANFDRLNRHWQASAHADLPRTAWSLRAS